MKKASEHQIGGDHYKSMPIQPAEFSHRNKLGWLEGNVIKYICRHNVKGGKADLLKARHYIDLLLEWEYGEPDDIERVLVCGRCGCFRGEDHVCGDGS